MKKSFIYTLLVFICTIAISVTFFFKPPQFTEVRDLNRLTPPKGTTVSKIILKNGMETVLVSNPSFQESAAALCVEAGSWQDPKEYPGMAHLLEHMLFMGTKDYPNESEYQRYIELNNGMTNAFTESSATVYGFKISPAAFEEALHRFSRFFIDPLFSQSSLQRELQAIDQEYAKNIENDAWRTLMVLKETGNLEHPWSQFNIGNSSTLSKIPRTELEQWYQTHYSADKMHLVIYSPLPLEKLKKLVAKNFSSVPQRSIKKEAYPSDLLSSQQKAHWTYIKPIKDIKLLSLIWEIPESLISEPLTSVTQNTLCYSISSGNQEGLFSFFFKENLANNLSTCFQIFGENRQLFRIDVDLSDKGMQHLELIIQKIYQHLHSLQEKGFPQYLFDEASQQNRLNYQYDPQTDLFQEAMISSRVLIKEKLDTFPMHILAEVNPSSVLQELVNYLTPENCAYTILADPKLTGVLPTQKEKWMGVEYAIQPIDPNLLISWKDSPSDPSIKIPSPNPYIPEKLELLPIQTCENDPKTKRLPQCILDNNSGKVYYLQGYEGDIPTSHCITHIKTPTLDRNAESMVLLDTYINALAYKITALTSNAQRGGLYLNFYQREFGLEFTINGFSNKFNRLLQDFFANLQQINITENEFLLHKEALLASYSNTAQDLPLSQSFERLNTILFHPYPSYTEKCEALKKITYERFQKFCSEIFNSSYHETMIYGNLTKEEAQQISTTITAGLNSAPFPKHLHKSMQIFKPHTGPLLIKQPSSQQGNGIILALYQGPFSKENKVVQDLLTSSIKESFFTSLRTQQQTGYIVYTYNEELNNHLFQFFAVQSNSHSCLDVLTRMNVFLENFDRTLEETFTKEVFQKSKNSLIQEMKKPFVSAPEKTKALFFTAFRKDADFEWGLKQIETVENLSYERFLELAHGFFSPANRLKIAILTEGKFNESSRSFYKEICQDNLKTLGEYLQPLSIEKRSKN